MAILDAQLLFSDSQAVTVTAASTNYIDLSAVSQVGAGEPIGILVQVDTAFSDLSGTLSVGLQTDDNTSFSSPTTLFTTAAIADETLAQGYEFPMPNLPSTGLERYIRLYYTGTGTLATGTVTAALVIGRDTYSVAT